MLMSHRPEEMVLRGRAETFRFGEVTVRITDGFTNTRMPDGAVVQATHDEQEGQAALAAELGYDSAAELNRHHDLAHSLLSRMIGLEASPTLTGVASRAYFKYWEVEEQAVLALQAFCKVAGVDLMEVARRYSDKP
jgi:hypothetical protein